MIRRSSVCSPAILIAAAILFSGDAPAQEVPPRLPVSRQVKPSDINRVFVPADRPADWPKGDWQAIDAGETVVVAGSFYLAGAVLELEKLSDG